MTIVLADYGYDGVSGDVEKLNTLTTLELDKKFKEVKRFIQACSSPTFATEIAETAKYRDLVELLTQNLSKLEKITILYATTSCFSGRLKEFKADNFKGIKINKQIYDLNRHHDSDFKRWKRAYRNHV